MTAAATLRQRVLAGGWEGILVILIAAHLLLKGLMLWQAWQAPLIGDEFSSVDGAKTLSNLLRDLVTLRGPDSQELVDNIIGNGWFLPGQSLLLAPLFLLSPDAGPGQTHLYVGVLTSLALVFVVLRVRRQLGPATACAVLAMTGLLPQWVGQSFRAWGDVLGGLAALAVIVCLAAAADRIQSGRAPSRHQAIWLGVAAVAALYLRSSLLPFAAAALGGVLCGTLIALRGVERRRGLLSGALAGGVFVLLLAPWSFAATQTLGAPVVTTTTIPLARAMTFNEPQACLGPCDPGNKWYAGVRFSREVAALTGSNELTVQREMEAHALTPVSGREYLAQVRDNFDRFALRSGDHALVPDPDPGSPYEHLMAALDSASDVVYTAALVLLLVAALWVTPASVPLQVMSLVISVSVAAMFSQPFLHVSSDRYWAVFVPLMGLALAFLPTVIRSRRTPRSGLKSLWYAQALTSLGLATIGVLVVLA